MSIKRSTKEVGEQVPNSLYLTVLDYIKKGFNPARISKILKLNKNTVQYYVSLLKKDGLIKKVGYGTWEINKVPTSTKQVVTGLRESSDFVRLHRLQVSIPILKWVRKPEPSSVVASAVSYWRVQVGGVKIKVFKSVLDCYLPQFWGGDKRSVDLKFLGFMRDFIPLLEKTLGVNVDKDGWKVSRREYASVGHPVAELHDRKRERLLVVDDRGEHRLVVDRSLDVPEFESVHPVKSSRDFSLVVEGFYKELLNGKWEVNKKVLGASLEEMKLIREFVMESTEVLKENVKRTLLLQKMMRYKK